MEGAALTSGRVGTRKCNSAPFKVTRTDRLQRSAITTVLFLLGAEDISHWHCVHGGDDIWIFLGGVPRSLLQHSDGTDGSPDQVISVDQHVA